MIKAVIFDYFGVVATDAFWNDAHQIAHLNGDASKLHNLIENMDGGELNWQKFCEDTGKLLGVSASQVNERAQDIQVNKELIVYMDSLKQKGLKIGLLSNASSEYLLPLLDKAHLAHVFDEIVVSSDVGASKPSPVIYKEMLKRLQIEPYEAIFIDDMPANVAGAESAGIPGVQFFDTVQTKRDIERLLNQYE